MIVAIEGIDASGKATQVRNLSTTITQFRDWVEVVHTHDFPHYESVAGGCVGRVLRGETLVVDPADVSDGVGMAMDTAWLKQRWSTDKALIIQGMMIVDRMEWQHELLQFKHDSRKMLILDRYTLSGVAYGTADGLDTDWLMKVQNPLIQADLHIVLDIEVAESIRRRPDRRDYYEKNAQKLQTVREVYRVLGDRSNVDIVDGSQSESAVTNNVLDAIKRWFNFS